MPYNSDSTTDLKSNWLTSGYDNLPYKYEQSVKNSAQICRAEQFNKTAIKLCIVSPWYTCTSALYEYFYLQHLCAWLGLALMSSFELGGAQFVSLLNPTCLSNQLNHLSLFIITVTQPPSIDLLCFYSNYKDVLCKICRGWDLKINNHWLTINICASIRARVDNKSGQFYFSCDKKSLTLEGVETFSFSIFSL